MEYLKDEIAGQYEHMFRTTSENLTVCIDYPLRLKLIINSRVLRNVRADRS